jgi:hypothetical protein
MARRNGQPADSTAEARRQLAAARQSREGRRRVEDDRKERADRLRKRVEEAEQRLKAELRSPDFEAQFEALNRQKVRLKRNGAEMEWGQAQDIADTLRSSLTPREFKRVMAMFKGGAPGYFSAKERRLLKGAGILGEDGGLSDAAAKVLEASLVEKTGGDGITLADPVAYTKAFVEKWGPVLEQWEKWLERHVRLGVRGTAAEFKMDPSREAEFLEKAAKRLGLKPRGDGRGRC